MDGDENFPRSIRAAAAFHVSQYCIRVFPFLFSTLAQYPIVSLLYKYPKAICILTCNIGRNYSFGLLSV